MIWLKNINATEPCRMHQSPLTSYQLSDQSGIAHCTGKLLWPTELNQEKIPQLIWRKNLSDRACRSSRNCEPRRRYQLRPKQVFKLAARSKIEYENDHKWKQDHQRSSWLVTIRDIKGYLTVAKMKFVTRIPNQWPHQNRNYIKKGITELQA